ncbi:glutathione S-transferase N-terminal domain-containing protein [Clostridium sp. MSJ-11]|uniref:Glutathione S-transferase N-terminal domain-containing protein n=1 Tax=Clostridium mobile TaxID=2841512 RepID=A0ABS6EDN0_9CLOT|nr:glutaredoxin domain-containing protein [Clostridium mobile]MBU5483252.1 glutathione S-transferase N-terminal domain-containing protein [Clostridium mobile]
MNVIVYTTPTCPWCKVVKDYLKSNDVDYVEYDVSKDDKAAAEMISKSGQMGVPVIDLDGNIIVGFDQESIDRILGL